MTKRFRPVDIVFAAVTILVGFAFILSASIIVPTGVRWYYFIHCHILDIPGTSGYSMDEIRLAFNDVMDFIWHGAPFATGNLPHSEEGMAHFADCVPLFWANAIAFMSSTAWLIVDFVLLKTKTLRPCRFGGVTPLAYSAFALIGLTLVLGVWGLIDFNSLFIAFHSLAFPGKDNWVFNVKTDPIIKILPESFFACCAAYIGTSCLLISGGMIAYSFITMRRYKKTRRDEDGQQPA